VTRTQTEAVLARIWEEVLGIGEVGPDEDFFELGGDSLLAVTMVSRARQVGLELSVKDVYQHTVLSDLAGRLAPDGPMP
jgi:aryl carrier-like protein